MNAGQNERWRRVERWLAPVIWGTVALLVASGCSVGERARPVGAGSETPSTTVAVSMAPAHGPGDDQPPSAGSPTARLFESVCEGTAVVEAVGALDSADIIEASGLVASRANDGVWWTHNDSGDAERIFAIDEAGALTATVELQGAKERDWEDIAVGPASDGDGSVVYVGDTGDNAIRRDPSKGRGLLKVFRFDEPLLESASAGQRLSVDVDTLTFEFPGAAHDVEAMMVDPVEGDLVFITKDWGFSGRAEVFRGDPHLAAGTTAVLERVGSVQLPIATMVTAADVSSDGTVVALRSYGAVHLFARPEGQPIWAAFESEPCNGPPLDEAQGESLGFAADGGSYLTLSEGAFVPLHRTSPS